MPELSSRPQTLKTADFKYYLTSEVQLLLYKKINVAGSLEQEVDEFDFALLREVFTPEQGFSITWKGRVQRAGRESVLAVRALNNDKFETVIICESRRREYERQSGMWAEALQQAVENTISMRQERGRPQASMYLTVNIGTYVRFYELRHDENQARAWAPARDKCYELADDEADVWRLLHELRYATYSSTVAAANAGLT